MNKQRKGWVITLVFTMMMTMFLAACGKSNTASPTPAPSQAPAATTTPAATAAPTPAASKLKVAMVSDVGGVNDNSFNQSAWEGLGAFKKATGSDIQYLQSKSPADYQTNLSQFVKQGYNLTWGIGFMMGDAVKAVATANKDAKLAIIDAVVDAPNVASITFKEHEGSFLVGVVAGLTTKSNKIGFVGGADIPVIKRFEAGFVAGVKAVKPDAKVIINYTGKFDAPDLGKSAAATIFGSGADIIFQAAGQTGDGVFNEGKERKKKDPNIWVIGVDKDQSITFGNEITLTSMMKRVDQAVLKVSNDLAGGKFTPGITELGLKEMGVGLPEKNPNVPADVLAKVKDFQQQIIDGKIKVPAEPAK
jgi:basic membrane protein A and related proteins